MATVFMKWLESTPERYDRGIQILTLGRSARISRRIATEFVQPGMRVLEVGCGTGELAVRMARRGAEVIGIDASAEMLSIARERVMREDLDQHLKLEQLDASLIGERYAGSRFDLIVSTLVFSEFSPREQRYVLESASSLLAPGGRMLIADEVIPQNAFGRLVYHLVRLPLVILTWLLTRTSTNALRDFGRILAEAQLQIRRKYSFLGGSLLLFEISPASEAAPEVAAAATLEGRLQHRVNLRTMLIDLWALFFRIIPPYPKVRPGLYAVGRPDRGSPVLVTGNFDLTVRRVVRDIDGRLDAWLLVADSAGINVWCAAGGGYLTAEKVISAVKTSRLEEAVDHRALVLPQLCANGVDGWKIRKATGWGVHWGPAKAVDIPAYLSMKRKKTDAMRWVKFPLKDRLEMVTVTVGFYGLFILIPVFLFWRPMFWKVAVSMLGLSYVYAVIHPWLPGKDGLYKSIPMTLIALAGLLTYSLLFDSLPYPRLFNWTVGLIGLSVFVSAELQGMSPVMRGEQSNWGWEALIALILGLIYWLIPMTVGWR